MSRLVQQNEFCYVTGNPCGTDTWETGKPCHCPNCQAWLHGEMLALAARVRELEALLEDVAPDVYRPQSSGFAEKCGHVTLALGYNWCPECWEKRVRDALAFPQSPQPENQQ